MTPFRSLLRLIALLTLSGMVGMMSSLFCPALLAQGPVPNSPGASVEPASNAFATPSHIGEEHKFWDRENRILFAASAAFSGADFAVTRANLQSGGRDLNPVVRFFGPSTAGLAVNFAGETAGVIGTKPAITSWSGSSPW